MSANEETTSVADAFGGWPGLDVEAAPEVEPAADEGNTGDGPSTPQEQPTVTEPEAPSDEGSAPVDGEPELPEWKQYGFKDENAMWASYKELQRTLTQQRAPAPEEEDEVEEEGDAPTWQSHQFQALGEIPRVGLSAPQREQLADLMAVDPKAAALWALQNQQYMEPHDFKAVQNNWAQNDPFEYHEFRTALAMHMQDQQRAETESSRASWVETQQREFAIDQAKQALPLMDERSDEFGQWLNEPENREISQMLDSIQDPERLQRALIAAFYQYAGPSIYQELTTSHQQAAAAEAERTAQAAAEEEAREAASKRGRTQTRSQPAPAGGGSDADEELRQKILNPHG